MQRRTKSTIPYSPRILAVVILICLLPLAGRKEAKKIHAQIPEQVAPPKESKYAGLIKCAACHFKQYEDWKATPHAKAFDYLPPKYRNNDECLQCHTSLHEPPPGQGLTNDLPGVSCEDCHGPGGEHTNLALSFVSQDKELTDGAVEMLRSNIERIALGQCVQCHTSMGHKPHPRFDREERSKRRQQPRAPRNRGFFNLHNPT